MVAAHSRDLLSEDYGGRSILRPMQVLRQRMVVLMTVSHRLCMIVVRYQDNRLAIPNSCSLHLPVSSEYQRLRFQGDVVDMVPHGSSLAQSSGTLSDSPVVGTDGAHSRNLPSEDAGNARHPAGPRVAFA